MLQDPSIRALVLSSAAGLSTLIGACIVLFTKNKSEKLVTASLGFAAGVMLSVSFTDLYPNTVSLFSASTTNQWGVFLSVFFLVVGILLAAMLDQFVPHDAFDAQTGESPHKNLFRTGVVSTLAIALHNFPEGIATFMAGYEDITLGVSIALAIALHNIPEGIAVAMPIYFSTGSKKKACQYTFLSGIAEPAGAFLAFLILRQFMNDFMLAAIFGVVAGIMIYICMEELIPSSRQYGHDRLALIATLTGICLMPLTHML